MLTLSHYFSNHHIKYEWDLIYVEVDSSKSKIKSDEALFETPSVSSIGIT